LVAPADGKDVVTFIKALAGSAGLGVFVRHLKIDAAGSYDLSAVFIQA
jgi:hypothetical protein